MSTMNDAFTVKQVAEELGVTSTRIRQICIEHEIGHKIDDFMRLLSEEDIEQIKKIRNETAQPNGTITVAEAAKRLGIGSSRVRQLCNKHNIGEKSGQTRYLTSDDLKKLKAIPRKPGRPRTNF